MINLFNASLCVMHMVLQSLSPGMIYETSTQQLSGATDSLKTHWTHLTHWTNLSLVRVSTNTLTLFLTIHSATFSLVH